MRLLLGLAGLPAPAAPIPVPRASAPHFIDVKDTEDGLPQNSVIAMTQTRDGYLWLGTFNGLARFDGLRFTVFDESKSRNLPSGPIVSLFEDSERTLWIGTEASGVVLLRDGQLASLPIGPVGSEKRLVSISEKPLGVVWLYTANGEVWRYEHGRNPSALTVERGTPSDCRIVVAEPGGPVWIGTDRGQYAMGLMPDRGSVEPPFEQHIGVTNRLDFLLASARGGYWRLADGVVQKWKRDRSERDFGPYPWGRTPVSSACEDRQGNLVVGTKGAGVFLFGPEGTVTPLSTAEGLSHNLVLSVLVDREDTLWVGTDSGGLNRVKRKVFDLVDGTQGLTVRSVCEDGSGGLWVGFNILGFNTQGAGLLKDGAWSRFGPAQGLMNSSVWAVLADRTQRIWAGTWGGLFQGEAGRFQLVPAARGSHPVVLAIHEDRAGRLWLGTRGGLVRRDDRDWTLFTSRDGLSSDVVTAMADDLEGNLWIGTDGGGLNRLRDGQFTAFRQEDSGLPSDNVSSLWMDDQGVLWIGTTRGLARYHRGRWTRYTTREGLIRNGVGYLLEDGHGSLWIGSNAGLMRVPKRALNDFAQGLTNFIPCRAYGKTDGLPVGECTSGSQPGACRTHDGRLWFPTIKGLVCVTPAELQPNTNPPPVVIEAVLIDDVPLNTNALRVGWPQTITIPPGRERLDIRYTSLNLAAAERARFRYRLEGFETGWFDAEDKRSAHYGKLPPGRYRFEVTACNEDGYWNETGSSLAFVVEPPFWRTWWFLTTAALGLLVSIVASVHYVSTQKLQRQLEGMRQKEALEQERSRIARDLHDQLGASLTQVSLLGEMAESDKHLPAEVETHARQITHTARETTRVLDEIVWAVNPSNDTLDGLITYVCKYAQEYFAVAGLQYRLDVPAQLPSTPIPPEVRHNVFLALKEAVTNVVKHAQASAARIRLRLEPHRFILEVEDNGRGLASREGQADRNGLRNMRKRMQDIDGEFSIGPAAQGGTVVRLTAPVGGR